MRLTKTFLAGAATLMMMAAPALAQQGPGYGPEHPPVPPPGHMNGPGPGYPPGHPPGPPPGNYHHGPSGPNGHWVRGDYYNGHRDYVAHGDWNRYHLQPPPPGYQWVNNNGQFLLIAISTGIVASIIAGSAYGY